MAITLDVNDYCQNCRHFEPDVEKNGDEITYFDHDINEFKSLTSFDTVIRCKGRAKCKEIMRFLKANKEKKEK